MKLDGATRTLFTTLSNGFVDFIFRKKELDQFIQDIQSIFLEIFELKPIKPWLTLYLEIHLVFLRVQRGEKLTPKLMQLRSLAWRFSLGAPCHPSCSRLSNETLMRSTRAINIQNDHRFASVQSSNYTRKSCCREISKKISSNFVLNQIKPSEQPAHHRINHISFWGVMAHSWAACTIFGLAVSNHNHRWTSVPKR